MSWVSCVHNLVVTGKFDDCLISIFKTRRQAKKEQTVMGKEQKNEKSKRISCTAWDIKKRRKKIMLWGWRWRKCNQSQGNKGSNINLFAKWWRMNWWGRANKLRISEEIVNYEELMRGERNARVFILVVPLQLVGDVCCLLSCSYVQKTFWFFTIIASDMLLGFAFILVVSSISSDPCSKTIICCVREKFSS